MPTPGRSTIVLVFGVLTLVWGTTWAAIRVSLEGFPPIAGVALRFAIASAVLLALAFRLGVPLGRAAAERRLWAANAVLSFCISYGVVYWSEQFVPSGLAAVLFATFPLFVALIAHVALPDERLGPRGALGTVLGFAGVAAIFSEDFSKLGGRAVLLAAAVMLVSPIASALASVAVKRWGRDVHPLSITAVPMGIAAVVMGALAAVTERGLPLTFAPRPVAALLYLAIPGSALTFGLYFWLLAHVRATRVALIAYTTPLIAVAVGALAFDEPLTGRTALGSCLVVAGVALAVSRPRVSDTGA